MEEKKQYKYDAFISYRHLETDAFVAGSLHKMLEGYKLPPNLLKEQKRLGKKTKIQKVFRDAEELPLTSNLNDTIMEALENSEYLIAICSPAFLESMWCKKEVETFIALRGREHVLTVLVDGEPESAFPPELLYKEQELKRPDGTIEIVREEVEPLAANARGRDKKERLKNLKVEVLRLMAPMFECNFDDLKQRQKEQKLHRIVKAVSMAAVISLLFAVFSTAMLLEIRKQNEQITEQNLHIVEQNSQILDQSDQIKNQAEQIEAQYQEALYSKGVAVAENARNMLEKGDRIGAIRAAYEVYGVGDTETPYISQVEYVLSDALFLYENGENILPDRKVVGDTLFNALMLSPQGDKVLTRDLDGVHDIWDTKTGEKLFSIEGEKGSDEIDTMCFKNEDILYYYKDNKIWVLDIPQRSSRCLSEFNTIIISISYSESSNRLLVVGREEILIFDTASEECVADITREDMGELDYFKDISYLAIYNSSKVSKLNNQYFAVKCSGLNQNDATIAVFDAVDGHFVDAVSVGEQYIGCITGCGNRLYFTINYTEGEEEDFLSTEYRGIVYAYDITPQGLVPVWDSIIVGEYVYDIVITDNGEGEYIAARGYNEILLLDRKDGSIFLHKEFAEEVVLLRGYTDTNMFVILTGEGAMYTLSAPRWEVTQTTIFKYKGNRIMDFEIKNSIASIEVQSNEMTFYTFGDSPLAKETEKREDNYSSFDLNSKQKEALSQMGIKISLIMKGSYDQKQRFMGVSYQNGTVEIFRVDEEGIPYESCTKIVSAGVYSNNILISPREDLVILVSYGEAWIYRTDGMDLSKEFPGESEIVGHVSGFLDVDFEKNCIYVDQFDQTLELPLYTREQVKEIAEQVLAESK